MADDPYARIAELEAENAVLREREATLTHEVEHLRPALAEALAQQTATAEVLGVIASSPADLQAVTDEIATNAARLCNSDHVSVERFDGDSFTILSAVGGLVRVGTILPLSRSSLNGRAVFERRTVHVHDRLAEDLTPTTRERAERMGWRTVLVTPMLGVGQPIGAIAVFRREVRPFSDSEIALLETFADQAVIAIENARLFEELEERNAELQESNRQVTEALEQQTALGEVLRLIASSPTDVQHVLDAICETAARLCDTPDAAIHRYRARDGHLSISASTRAGYNWIRQVYGTTDFDLVEGFPLSREGMSGRAFLDQRAIVVDDHLAEAVKTEFPGSPAAQARWGHRSQVTVPLVNQGESIGVLTLAHRELHPFTERQIALLGTFADQAVIAIENARLFEDLERRNDELSEALEQQTATAEVLRIIATTPTDLERVLDAIVQSAMRLSGSMSSSLTLRDGDVHRVMVLRGDNPGQNWIGETRDVDVHTPGGHALLARRTVHLPDRSTPSVKVEYPSMTAWPPIASLAVPLVREDAAVGVLFVTRDRAQAYSAGEIALVETFADQAVIAIENARLFNELQAANQQLAEASEHKSQFLANMSHELRTPLNAIIGYSEMLQEEAEDLDQQTMIPDLQRVNSAGKHLLGLINDILDLSKIEAGRMDLFLETFDARRMVHDVAAIVEPLVEKNGNTLILSCSDEIGAIRADQMKLRQALFNLLSNAAKFTACGTIELRVARE